MNVRAGILRDRIVSPIFLDGNLAGQITRWSISRSDDWKLWVLSRTLFDIPIRWSLSILRMDKVLDWPELLWNSRPGLTSLDYFLWGDFKSKIHSTEPAYWEELRRRTVEEYHQITTRTLKSVRIHFKHLIVLMFGSYYATLCPISWNLFVQIQKQLLINNKRALSNEV